MARKTKLTAEVQSTIVKALELGSTYLAASNAAGISYPTFNNWMNEGRAIDEGERRKTKSNEAKLEFFYAIKRAEGNRQARWLGYIEQAAKGGNWQAAAWKLERTDPENFGRQLKEVKHSGSVDVVNFYIPDNKRDANEDN